MANDKSLWTKVDQYFGELLAPSDEVLDAALAANHKAKLPAIDITSLQGRFLELLVHMSGARRVLEIGTLGGYSTIWLARGLPPDGRLITLESDTRHAEVARSNLARAGLGNLAEVRVGRALDTLPRLAAEGSGPFDLIFIDADKENNAAYFQWALDLSRPGSLIVADNVVREGEVADPRVKDRSARGVRRMIELMAAEPGVSATVIQTVGSKGYDGFALARVL